MYDAKTSARYALETLREYVNTCTVLSPTPVFGRVVTDDKAGMDTVRSANTVTCQSCGSNNICPYAFQPMNLNGHCEEQWEGH